MIPQLIYLGIAAFGAGFILANHGNPKGGEHNILTSLIAEAIIVGLLYWGGFFDCFFK